MAVDENWLVFQDREVLFPASEQQFRIGELLLEAF